MTRFVEPPLALIAGAGSHLISVDPVDVPYVVEHAGFTERKSALWFVWRCTCTTVSKPGVRWSFPESAQAMGVHHALKAVGR